MTPESYPMQTINPDPVRTHVPSPPPEIPPRPSIGSFENDSYHYGNSHEEGYPESDQGAPPRKYLGTSQRNVLK